MHILIEDSVASTYRNANGEIIHTKTVIGDDGRKHATIKEFSEFLKCLIDLGYGDFDLAATTQDGASYNVTCKVEITDNECMIV